jgi:hypothetical protein
LDATFVGLLNGGPEVNFPGRPFQGGACRALLRLLLHWRPTMENLFQHPEVLVLFLICFVPGLVMLNVWDHIVAQGSRRDFSKSIFEAVAYSAINLGFFLPLIEVVRSGKLGPVFSAVAIFVILLGAPATWPFLLRKILSSRWLTKYGMHPDEAAWDFVFGQHEPFWAVVHLRDLRRVGGRFAANSFVSSSPAEPQIYLEEVWKLDEDGRLCEPIERSRGIVILGKEILALRSNSMKCKQG